ncbi:MAG: hypothetical protein HY811_04875 [Planctomycetes bacterium]|nr:hypothetical protein [Planctomycetota bacterium]
MTTLTCVKQMCPIFAFASEAPIIVRGAEQSLSGTPNVSIAIIIAGVGLIGVAFCLWLGGKKSGKTSC